MWLMSDSAFLNILILGLLALVIWRLSIKAHVALNTSLTVLLVIMIGYSSFATIFIRSNANPANG